MQLHAFALHQKNREPTHAGRNAQQQAPVVAESEGERAVELSLCHCPEKWDKLQEELQAVQADRAAGTAGCTLEELDVYLDAMMTGGE